MNDMIKKLLQIDQEILVEQIKHEEDENYYNVWKVIIDKKIYIFKKSSKIEESIYKLYLGKLEKGVPKLYKTITHNNEIYLLMEYFEGENICKASKDKLKVVLDNLIFEQNQFWNNVALDNPNYSYEYTILRRIDRGTYLKDSLIKKHYDKFLEYYKKLPRTLCHDDLLPFNVLVNNNNACIIDWEVGGILPYPVSIARLIAHGKDNENYLFYMTDSDKEYAIKYYYDNFIKYKDISYEDYIDAINYFLLFEYCEWIMLKEKYQEEHEIHKEYYLKAINHIKNIENR